MASVAGELVSCWKCGNQYPATHKFCIKCGSRPTRPPSAAVSTAPLPSSSDSAPTASTAAPSTVASTSAAPTAASAGPQLRASPAAPEAPTTPSPAASTVPRSVSAKASPSPATVSAQAATSTSSGGGSGGAPAGGAPAGGGGGSRPSPAASSALSSSGSSAGGHACAECGSELSGGTVVTDAAGRSYHAACFRCCRCGTALTDNYHVVREEDGRERFYCTEDFVAAQAPQCVRCGKPITGEGAEDHTGAKYHLACFTCQRCGTPITGKYVVNPQGNLCGACSGGDGGTSSASSGSSAGRFRCGACGGELEGKVVGVGDDRFHPQCFQCSACKTDLTQNPFSLENGKLLCKKCLLIQRGEVCAACGQVIEEGALQAMTKLWHEACFRCGDCSQPIGAGQSYATKAETPICATCASK